MDPQPPGTYYLEICATMADYLSVLEACAPFTVTIVGGPAECTYGIVPSAPSQAAISYPWAGASASYIDLSGDLDAFTVTKSDPACEDVELTFTPFYQDLATT